MLCFIPVAEGLQGCVPSWICHLSTPHLILEQSRLPGRHKELPWGHSGDTAHKEQLCCLKDTHTELNMEPWNGLGWEVGQDLTAHLVPPLPWAGTSSPGPGGSKPYPAWP